MLAGYETTAVALTHCIYLLCKYPEAQTKLLEEVDQATSEICYEDLERFPYAAAVLKESLRLLGPAAFFSRVAVKDTQMTRISPPTRPFATLLFTTVRNTVCTCLKEGVLL